jgi:O-Antigen ligase
MTDQTAGLGREARAPGRLLAAFLALLGRLGGAIASRWRPPVLLPEYTVPHTSLSHGLVRVVGYSLAALFCFIYGAAFGVFAPGGLIGVLLIPLIALAVLVLWALPAMRVTPVRTLTGLFFFYTTAIALWPNYLAIALPGLPWVTLQRLADGPLVLVLLLCVKSKDFTQRLGAILNAERPIWIALCVFVLIQVVSLAFSTSPVSSVSQLLVAQADCTATFFLTAFLFTRKGTAMAWAFTLWGLEVVQGFIVAWESRVQHVLWRDHIPSFLKVDAAVVEAILGNGVRSYTGAYRAQGTFDGPIQMGEFTTLCFAFVIHFAVAGRTARIRFLARISAPILLVICVMCGSRSSAVGLVGTIVTYAFIHSVRLWRRDRQSLAGPLLALSYPIGGGLLLVSTFFVGRLKGLVWGNSSVQQASTQARYDQIHMAMPKLLRHPWGYGIGRAADVVGWVSAGGQLSLDNYYLTLVMDYGPQGLITYLFLFIYSIIKAIWQVIQLKLPDPELELLVPAAVALSNFLVVKSVFSQQDNHPLFFAVLGMVVALIYRAKNEGLAESIKNEAGGATSGLRPSPVLVGAQRRLAR